ncbi:hypothetical protein S7711_09373 [Stachybotrys chartarum IBT 7711]|uniref:tRNA wybutosine-synthesizing protein 2 n=1 Tax=Stachybotrys chartarum (strain CBS 109288 / IBT 7711) TaxID=1280523 RepID=A0A084AUW7_STACB|nr:hypothetical protein S7711_09373 [Stachybotrys chartarum IBT 7711]KFA49228.1 hypothetical protein S40293_09274 [Stachybotrys chartarum IBT 40293]
MPKQTPHQKCHPIQAAVQLWLDLDLASSAGQDEVQDAARRDEALSKIPKRFTIYEPMALLPTGSFTGASWADLFSRCNQHLQASLWRRILDELSRGLKGDLTHLAVNEGIPLHGEGQGSENILRSPSGLRMLYGNFGLGEIPQGDPTPSDFDQTLWVSTKQNGIYQTWAPRWTMFSRGNIKEKARLLAMGPPHSPNSSIQPTSCWAVDLYAGIGYFVFCYASLGMRVLCWELNPWSVEGLRRGAKVNRWSVRVVCGQDLDLPMAEIMAGGEQIVVFLEDNSEALKRIRQSWSLGLARDIRHVNCGFLPSSQPVWEQAWHITSLSGEACLHLHENVGVHDIESRRQSVQHLCETWNHGSGVPRTPNVEHVELVKTFAPGVWHCVFDVRITKSIGT